MSFSLIDSSWIPVRRRSGSCASIRPADITSDIDADPVVVLDWPRPEQRMACVEFLIGLLATAFPPADTDAWETAWRSPPCPDALHRAFAPIGHAFVLDGDGPRFMQDFDDFRGDARDVADLRVETARERSIRESVEARFGKPRKLRLECGPAAMALYCMQRYAGADGQAGDTVGDRHWPPVTTLAIPPGPAAMPLWRVLWANVPCGKAVAQHECAGVFPWLSPGPAGSQPEQPVAGEHAHPARPFWAMPRSLRLDFATAGSTTPRIRSIVGVGRTNAGAAAPSKADMPNVLGWRERPVERPDAPAQHPLTPNWPSEPDRMRLALRARHGGISYRDWCGLLFPGANGDAAREPAACIRTFREERIDRVAQGGERRWRLLVAGYGTGTAALTDFACSETAVNEPAPDARDDHDRELGRRIACASNAVELLAGCVRDALGMAHDADASPTTSAGVPAQGDLRERFWIETEHAFLNLAGVLRLGDGGVMPAPGSDCWLPVLRDVAFRLFAEAVGTADAEAARGKAQVQRLSQGLGGGGKDGAASPAQLGRAPAAPKLAGDVKPDLRGPGVSLSELRGQKPKKRRPTGGQKMVPHGPKRTR